MISDRVFDDRRQAGKVLAKHLEGFAPERPIVLGLPRGGVPVAYEVATALHAPLDVIIVRKLGVPFQPELGMGALGEDGVRVLNDDIVRAAHVTEPELAAVQQRELREVERRALRYRRGQPMIDIDGHTVILVDDGVATGGTARAALRIARAKGASRVILATPVAAATSIDSLRNEADEIIVLEAPTDLIAIGHWYRDFRQTSDGEVELLLDLAARAADLTTDPVEYCVDADVVIPAGDIVLDGHLSIPRDASGIVVYAHGSGSSRHSPRNRSVAEILHQGGIGTLLFDLLSPSEAIVRSKVVDTDLLAQRLSRTARWLSRRPDTQGMKIGYFGSSTGAAAAMLAATRSETPIAAIVARGGRPDLVPEALDELRTPTLLIVGGEDHAVTELNLEAAGRLHCEHRIESIPGATHLFEEPGALTRVAVSAQQWFRDHFDTD